MKDIPGNDTEIKKDGVLEGGLPELRIPQLVPTTLEKLKDYSNNLERLTIHQLENSLRAFEAPRDTSNLYQIHPTQHPFIFQFVRNPQTGKVISYKEVETSSIGETSKNSLSLTRALGPQNESVKGNSTNLPFWPGGFDDEKKAFTSKFSVDTNLDLDESQINAELFGQDLLQSPPGLPTVQLEFAESSVQSDINNFSSLSLEEDSVFLDFWQGKAKAEVQINDSMSLAKLAKKESSFKRLLRELPDEISIPTATDKSETQRVPVLKISKTPANYKSSTSLPWAEPIDVSVPMSDFHDKVPDMAFKYPFELDTFQKQAIWKLEEHENVFVAAHTSAGKTVVAEYAIALSVRHMTRTVYTSPIKALSNQKFRDFKNNFESVGLITGDVQINSAASCLIMTTEILRSMLYNGSDVIRDLEWVIFDEIHYLNNEERGHVWEEVLIMLPQHVSIIMLSATVPNALDFANWVGEIKKKKIYVISTTKRPVPLEHHLYTGSGGKSRNEQFLILDGSGKFIKKGYDDAKEAKTSRMSKHQQSFGPKGSQKNTSDNFEKTLYVGLVSHLKENDNLPVVIFTFSRNRCDTYAQLLSSTDLCTGAQKAEIHGFFQKSISRLKGSDKELPQVLVVQEMLKNGVGVHHSGILPILKEVVEMLFQKGLVKLLFATETFAMGVNMPARTVVFDTIRKHDGTQFRTLNPAEYIQMAGRAGRRGLDTTGTVIILCKNFVPDMMELQAMMQGRAAKLESQFRLTYSMILNLLRVESLSVEDVMKRSFLEAGTRTLKVEDIKNKLVSVKEKLEELDFEPRNQDLQDFYNLVKDYLQIRDSMTDAIMRHPRMTKELCPGRLIIFESLPLYNPRIGIILNPMNVKEGGLSVKKFRVLTLISDDDKAKLHTSEWKISNMTNADLLEGFKTPDVLDRKFRLFLYHAHDSLTEFVPNPKEHHYPKHTLLTLTGDHILEVLPDVWRFDAMMIENDLKKRELPRFRNDLPGQSLMDLLIPLEDYNTRTVKREIQLSLFRPLQQTLGHHKGLDIDIQKGIIIIDQLRGCLKIRNYFDTYPNFVHQFREVFFYMRLVDEKNNLEYLMSPKSLRLHEEYQARIAVLQRLGYIDSENLVQLKGRVACEMGNQNELMVTELIFNNVLSDCPPVEVAALLSCMVFEAKNVPEPKLMPDARLKQKVEDIKDLARTIGTIQRECGVSESIDAYVEQFKFGLVEVVYEWAQGKPFANIMNLTEVQEGLIVRTIQRLDEMLKDVKDAARIIGDPTLKKKMEEASECIKRDIVFAASLYTQ